ncbi:MAG: diphthine synthase [Candidatus Aenigmatarchaeota archaeon]
MLNLVGLGLWDENGLTLEGIEISKNSDEVFIETYTSVWYGSIENLEKIIDKKIGRIGRGDLEDKFGYILKKSKVKKITILIPGDPLVATTHLNLILEAKKMGIDTRVVHNSSIYSAVGETGLHLYKFGYTITIPFPEKTKGEKPNSIFERFSENRKRGLHTLCLLDISSEEKKYMTPNEGIKILLSGGLVEDDYIIVFCRAGSKNSDIFFGMVRDLIELDFGDPPYVIIIPGELHFTEKEFLDYYGIKIS